MRVAITGANGFIGRALLARLDRGGAAVIALTRNPRPDSADSRHTWIRYSLEEGIGGSLPDDCDVLIHCAYGISATGKGDIELNVNAVKALQSAAAGRRIVFISSMSAHPGALSAYGRGKWAIEGMLRKDADLVIKPGFVIGPGGIFERLRRSLQSLPFVPLFYGGNQPIQTIWVEDLVEAIAVAVDWGVSGVLALGSAEAIPIREFYRAILASDRLKKPLVPVPGKPSLIMLRILEKLGVRLPMSSENLLGLLALREFETKHSLELLGIRPIGLVDALQRAHPCE
jgi:nucleoside-diphosphate-sugar epimerase